MTGKEIVKDFSTKVALPVVAALLLYGFFSVILPKDDSMYTFYMWIACGMPFGLWRKRTWIVPHGDNVPWTIAVWILNFIIAGLIGGGVLAWLLLRAIWYLALTIHRTVTYIRYNRMSNIIEQERSSEL